MRKTLLTTLLFIFANACQAQINCSSSTKLACIIPNQLNLTQQSSQNLAFLNEAIGSQVSELPLASPASGVIYTNDPKLNIPVPSNATLGPILTQRAETIGYHKYFIAFTYQYFSFNVIDGVPDNIVILEFEPVVVGVVTTHMGIDCGRHRRDVTDTGNVPGHDHQTGKLPAYLLGVVSDSDVLELLIRRG